MKNKSTIISTLICILPMVLSAVLYSRLPEQVAVHFNSSGVADSYQPKSIAAFGMPVFLAVVNLYVHFRINKDPKNENASNLLKIFSKWLIPFISVVFIPITLFMAIGTAVPILLTSQAIGGAVIVVFGNYMPKCKRNYTIGIKLPWTLDNEDNWNKTHRFSGFVWVIGGFVILLNSFLSIPLDVSLGVIVLLVVIPFIYSYLLFQNQMKEVE